MSDGHEKECAMSRLLRLSDIDALADHVVQQIILPGSSARSVVRDLVLRMAQQFPGALALSPVLVLAIVAHGLDELFDESVSDSSLKVDLWRMATLLATDVMVLEKDSSTAGSLSRLLEHWQNDDTFFLG